MIKKRGFTLIELLVVISIIGILISLGLTSYTGAQKQARDNQRKSDLAQYRNALQNFAANNRGLYPVVEACRNWANIKLCTSDSGCASPLLSYLTACPVDPLYNPNDPSFIYVYGYRTDGSENSCAGKATKFVLWSILETGDYWMVCSGGKSGKYNIPAGSNSLDAICAATAGGACPI